MVESIYLYLLPIKWLDKLGEFSITRTFKGHIKKKIKDQNANLQLVDVSQN
jgi:hypothetical protein